MTKWTCWRSARRFRWRSSPARSAPHRRAGCNAYARRRARAYIAPWRTGGPPAPGQARHHHDSPLTVGRAANPIGSRLTPRIELLRSGVDAGRFQPNLSGATIRQRHGLGSGPVIVSVARLVPRKGHDRLIAALPEIARAFPTVRLLVVGAGPSRSRLQRLATRYQVGSHVVFAGAVSDADLPGYFAAGDMFAMPCQSRWAGLDTEGLGTVFLQAAAVGKPALAGRSGGAPEAVLDGETGIVVDASTSAEVAAGILRLLSQPEQARALGASGSTARASRADLAAARPALRAVAERRRRHRDPVRPRNRPDSRMRSDNSHPHGRNGGSGDNGDRLDLFRIGHRKVDRSRNRPIEIAPDLTAEGRRASPPGPDARRETAARRTPAVSSGSDACPWWPAAAESR